VATFSTFFGKVLSIFDDNQNNLTTVSRDAAGTISINNGAVPIVGRIPAVTNTLLLQVFGAGGNDTIELDETNGALPRANLFGGSGDDSLTGGSSDDLLFGGADNDTLNGKGGRDLLFGGSGNDIALGGDGNDTIFGEGGNDTIVGGRGDDVAFLGAGDDIFVWNPGEADDTIEGGTGFDTMQFNGNNAAEKIDLFANGERLRFLRDVANITMDTDDVERVNFEAFGGADTITVGDLSSTDVQEFRVNLAGTPGGTAGDGQNDSVTLNGVNEADFVDILGAGSSISIVGLSPFVQLTNVEAGDSLTVNGNGGDDRLSASGLNTPVNLTLDGGAGDDVLFGSDRADIFLGGEGDDFVDGQRGDDVAFLGDGDDAFLWNPGDGNDTIEGQAGIDSMLFAGNNASENIDISANGERLRFFRDVANVIMDTDDVERVDFNAFGGNDSIVINDLSGTDVNLIRLSLIGGSGLANDGLEDRILVKGTAADDAIAVTAENREVVVTGLPAEVRMTGFDTGIDRLEINAAEGNDILDASGLAGDTFSVTLNGDAGDDILLGSAGNDVLVGGTGNDLLLGGAGADSFRFNAFGEGVDLIADFAIGDTIQVLADGFGGDLIAGAPLDLDRFTLGTGAADADDRFIFNAGSGDLFFDVDGTGATAQVLLATVTGSIAATDISVI
jgi:Ca2+-binding RTX toxin-like protein